MLDKEEARSDSFRKETMSKTTLSKRGTRKDSWKTEPVTPLLVGVGFVCGRLQIRTAWAKVASSHLGSPIELSPLESGYERTSTLRMYCITPKFYICNSSDIKT
eukprot:3237246-Amphidinium_carterae.1